MAVFAHYTFILFALAHLAAGGPAAQRPTFGHFSRPDATTEKDPPTVAPPPPAQSSKVAAAPPPIQNSSPGRGGGGALLPVAANISPAATNATLLSKWGITRDGGGGGTIDGTHIINFSDTATGNINNPSTFVSNSVATTSGVSESHPQSAGVKSGE
jgi:hypothetical protein